MRLTCDSQVDALYIRFYDERIEVTTQRLSEDVAVNYAPDGRIVGIEVLDASETVFRSRSEPMVEIQNLAAVPARAWARGEQQLSSRGDLFSCLRVLFCVGLMPYCDISTTQNKTIGEFCRRRMAFL